MKIIELTQGKHAKVDDEDFESVNKWKWFAVKDRNKIFACTMLREHGRVRKVLMHRLIAGTLDRKEIETKHLDGDCLNNQKENLLQGNRSSGIVNRKFQLTAEEINSRHVGKKYGKLIILEFAYRDIDHPKVLHVKCRCECGSIKIVSLGNLRNGSSKSCGCTAKIKLQEIRKRATPKLSAVWCAMKNRCCNPKVHNYKNYGGRGISVCEEWRVSYKNFRRWALNNGYSQGLEIDRINVNGDYEPSNCRFVTRSVNQRNKRNNSIFQIGGERKTLAEWCEIYNTNHSRVIARLKYGWDIEKALSTAKKINQF